MTGWGQWAVLGLRGFGLDGCMWLIGVWLSGCKEQDGRVWVVKDFCWALWSGYFRDDSVGGCFTLVESLWLLLLIFCLLPANCFSSFFVWMRFSNSFVYNCLCPLSWNKKNVDCYQWIWLCLKMYICNYYFQFSIILLWEMGESMFCTAFLSRKTNFLHFNIKIVT